MVVYNARRAHKGGQGGGVGDRGRWRLRARPAPTLAVAAPDVGRRGGGGLRASRPADRAGARFPAPIGLQSHARACVVLVCFLSFLSRHRRYRMLHVAYGFCCWRAAFDGCK